MNYKYDDPKTCVSYLNSEQLQEVWNEGSQLLSDLKELKNPEVNVAHLKERLFQWGKKYQ